MKVYATLKNLRITPRKVRLVTHSMVGMDAQIARIQLSRQVKKSSSPLSTLLDSAVANATNNFGLDGDNLYIQAVRVGDGPRLKRWLPRAFGRATPLLRRGSNVTIILEEKVEGKNRVAKKETAQIVTETLAEESVAEKPSESQSGTLSDKKDSLGKHIGKKAGGKFVKKMFQRKAS